MERVIINFGANPDQLAIKIANLAKSWGESTGSADVAQQGSLPPSGSDGEAETGHESRKQDFDLTLPLAEVLERLAAGLQDRWPDLERNSSRPAARWRRPIVASSRWKGSWRRLRP